MTSTRSAIAAGLLALCGCAAPPSTIGTADAELPALSQALLDAVTAGDQDLFRRTLDPTGLFTDEDGVVRTGAEAAAAVQGLPPGYAGRLRLVDPRVHVAGGVGIVTYDVAETLVLYGQSLETRYHTTDVYRRAGGRWLLVASQTSVIPSELAPAPVDPAALRDYEGVYRLGDDAAARVWTEDGRLYMQREGGARDELLPIGGDRFVRAGAPRGERFFRRDVHGRITALVDRRDNNDLVWRRE